LEFIEDQKGRLMAES